MTTHNTRIQPDTFYVNGTPIPASYFTALDTAQEQAVTEAGGTWTGAASIGGAGMWACGYWYVLGSGIDNALNSGVRLVHGDNDYVVLGPGHAGASRNLVSSFGLAVDASYVLGNSLARLLYENVKDGLKNQSANTTYAGGGRLVMPLRVHNGATLSSVTIEFIVGSDHLPGSQPKARVIQVDASGNVTYLCSTTAAGYVGAGFIQAQFATHTTYYNAGAANSFALAIAAGVVIDTTRYTYLVMVEDEGGSSAASGNEFLSAKAAYSSIPDLRPQ